MKEKPNEDSELFSTKPSQISPVQTGHKGSLRKKQEQSMPRSSDVVKINALLYQLMARVGLEQRFKEQKTLLAWNEVVGKEVAAVTEPSSLRDGLLKVKVDRHAMTWKSELSYMKGEIIEKLNRSAGEEVVKDIKFY